MPRLSTTPFVIKKGDTGPSIQRTMEYSDSTVEDLTAGSVVFEMTLALNNAPDPNATPITGACVIVDAANGICRYDWSAGDTDVVGEYVGEFKVTNAAGQVITFPNGTIVAQAIYPDYIPILVVQDV